MKFDYARGVISGLINYNQVGCLDFIFMLLLPFALASISSLFEINSLKNSS